MKIVLIGGGSYVFAPTVLEDMIVKHRLAGCELVLVDLQKEAVEAMAAAGKRVARELGVTLTIRCNTERTHALPGADYVIVSASPQGAGRWQMDYDILREAGMPDQARECGGMGGMLNAFRSITLIMDICRDMEKLCPGAVLLDVTNPMPRDVTAVHRYSSIKTVGFCNIAYRGPDGYDFLPRLIGRQKNEVRIVTAGLNHFAWLLEIKDAQTGEDLRPLLERYILEGDWSGQPAGTRKELSVMRRWLMEYGGVAAGSVDHHAEYLPVQPDVHYWTKPPFHGNEAERRQRLLKLKHIANGQTGWEDLFLHGSWEHPVDVAVTLHRGSSSAFDIVNLPNKGNMKQLPDGRIVELPAVVRNGEIAAAIVPDLPEVVAALCRTVSDVHELVVEAAVNGSTETAKLAIELDPAVTDKKAAFTALDQMLKAHSDLLPQFK
ncbi:hypothetical protein O9H85_31955 [Paenibacillus filicis]|uniref:Glycosyl hydrolase family 4 C-terminal domain-containing protein n=1 Tax=Paenibacillus gyeongsangnamensis TaxID=3388067 RepID=A0ABT4QJD0_9BACL|nr:hypothetical protein [Paenibacillus filicis]MCZ8516892.1 hypothetical protein [Paenibacillus filicis]